MPLIRHEADILAALDGRVAPRLLADGDDHGRPFIAMTWQPGVDVDVAAAELREAGAQAARRGLLDLCRSILAAYAELHASTSSMGTSTPATPWSRREGSSR